MRLSSRVMGRFGTVLLLAFIILFSCCISLSECKRSACWRYGHSCWGAHGKRSGDGGGSISGESSSSSSNTGGQKIQHTNLPETGGGSRVFGMLDKATGKFVPFPVLSLMLMRNRDSYMHPPVGMGLHDISSQKIPFYQIKTKRSDPETLTGEGGSGINGEDSLSSQQQQQDYYASSSLSKEVGAEKSENTQEYEDVSATGEDSRRLSPFNDNSIFVRNRKTLVKNGSKSTESMSNSANEEDSQEVNSSLSQSEQKHKPGYYLNNIFSGTSRN